MGHTVQAAHRLMGDLELTPLEFMLKVMSMYATG
jgi:hypothetical protein